MSEGFGTSQFGGDHTCPSGFSVRRNNWQDARAIATPPEKKSASTTRMRRPSRISFVLTSIGVMMFGRRNMSTVSRAGTNSSPPWRCSIDMREQADDDAAVHRFRIPRAVRRPASG